MNLATEKQIKLIESLFQFETVNDNRFLKTQGYFINNAKKNMTSTEASNIIKYIKNNNGQKPQCFNKYICFDYGWNRWAVEEMGLAVNLDGMPAIVRLKLSKKEINKQEAQKLIKQMEEERFDYLLDIIKKTKD